MPEKNAPDQKLVKQQLDALIEYLSRPSYGKVEFWEMLAFQLSQAINRQEPWTWRYIQGVYQGHMQPSRDFAKAVEIVLAIIDGLHPLSAKTEQVTIYAFPKSVTTGSVVMGQSKICPKCKIWFVPNVPWRRLCPVCSPPRGG